MYWVEFLSTYIHKFAEDNFNPTPTTPMCKEFEQKLARKHVKDLDFTKVPNKLNFLNGVLDLETGELEEHNIKYGFTYVIPYAFEPKGDCPRFKKFIEEVMCGDKETMAILLEYLGYCITFTDPALVQKCAVFHGDGSNGKSVLLNIMQELVGKSNFSNVGLAGLQKETSRYLLMNKMFNVSSETPTGAFMDSSAFKAMVSGEIIEVRRLYADLVNWKCDTKLLFACNELPYTQDFSYGMSRRLIIFPFKNTFTREKGNLDPYIFDKIKNELSDIIVLLLESFRTLKARNYKFNVSDSISDELLSFTADSDSVTRFISEMCFYKEETEELTNSIVYRCYIAWCGELHVKPLSYPIFSKRFFQRLSVFYHSSIKRTRKNDYTGNKVTFYKHLAIRAATGM
jgi:putative DNA primase/helicase